MDVCGRKVDAVAGRYTALLGRAICCLGGVLFFALTGDGVAERLSLLSLALKFSFSSVLTRYAGPNFALGLLI